MYQPCIKQSTEPRQFIKRITRNQQNKTNNLAIGAETRTNNVRNYRNTLTFAFEATHLFTIKTLNDLKYERI